MIVTAAALPTTPTSFTFNGKLAVKFQGFQYRNCHLFGSCIPDPKDCIVSTPEPAAGAEGGAEGQGSVAVSIFFRHRDGAYRNALRQVLEGTRGAAVVTTDMKMLDMFKGVNLQEHEVKRNGKIVSAGAEGFSIYP